MVVSAICAYNPLQPGSAPSPTVGSNLSPTATVAVRFIEPTPTETVAVKEAKTEEAAPDRAVENGRPLAARVNNQPIFLDAFERQISQLKQALKAQEVDLDSTEGQSQLTQIRQQAFEILVEQVIIEQQADDLGLVVTQAEVEALALETAKTQAQLERWLTENQLTYDEFVNQLRIQLLTNRVFEHITQDVTVQSDSSESQEILFEQKKQVFDSWLLKQKSAADIERYVAL